MNIFTIKDIENLSGIKAHTIRIWEQRYSFLKPQRTETNIRYYSDLELKSILNIALLHKYGYRISQIDRMNEEDIRSKIFSLSHSGAHQERIVNDLIQNMIDLDMDSFEAGLDNYIISKGIDRTINQIIFPFLERIGILWLTNHIHPTQERMVTNIIRQKLIVGIEGVMSHISTNKSALLFLPEGEFHELGLLYVYYLLKSRGIKVLYLGANVPLKDVAYITNFKKPDFLYSHLTCLAGNFNFDKFILQFKEKLPGVPFTISGQVARSQKP